MKEEMQTLYLLFFLNRGGCSFGEEFINKNIVK